MGPWRAEPTRPGWWWVRAADGCNGHRAPIPMEAVVDGDGLVLAAVPTLDFRLELSVEDLPGALFAPVAPPPALDLTPPDLGPECSCWGPVMPSTDCPQHGWMDLTFPFSEDGAS